MKLSCSKYTQSGSLAARRNSVIGIFFCIIFYSDALADDFSTSFASRVIGVLPQNGTLELKMVSATDATKSITFHVGQEYKEGWILKNLTNEIAVLSKGDELRRIGLNPGGIVNDEDGPLDASVVTVTANIDAAIRAGDHVAVREAGGTSAQIWAAMRQQAVNEGNSNAVRNFDGLDPLGPDKIPMVVNGRFNNGSNIPGFGGITGYISGRDPNGVMYWYRTAALAQADGNPY